MRQRANTWLSSPRTERFCRSTAAPTRATPGQISNVSYGVAQQEALIDEHTDATFWLPMTDAVDSTWTAMDFDALAHGFVPGKAALGYEGEPDSRNSFQGEFVTELPPRAHAV